MRRLASGPVQWWTGESVRVTRTWPVVRGPAVQVLDESLSMIGEGEACTLTACRDVPRLRGSIEARNGATRSASSFCCNVRSSVTGKWYQLVAGHSVTAPAQEYSHDGHRVGFVTGYASSGGIDSGRVYVYPEEESYWRDLKGNPSRWFVGAAGDAMPFKYVSLTPGTVVIGTAICRSGVKTGPNAGRFFKPMPIGIDTSTY